MRAKDRRFKRGAYLLPTLFTVGNLFCGYYASVAVLRQSFELAALLIFVAGILDALDGRVARLTGSTSEFGRELDSLADALSFGMAPALLVYTWALQPLTRVGWLASFLFVACGVVRLARFNIQTGSTDKRYFIGLPLPVAAAVLAACVTLSPARLQARWTQIAVLVLVLILSLLMVSKLRYRSFKEVDLKGRVPSVVVVVIALVFVGVASHPPLVVLLVGLAYVTSGMLPRRVWQRTLDRSGAPVLHEASEVDGGKRSA
jgi:CDP-diacylglycerol---serine O-phosphatidyltransferase